MEVAVGVVSDVAEKCTVVVKRAKLARIILSGMVGGKIDDYFDPVLMCGGYEIVKLRPRVTGIAEVFFDTFEVARLITVIRSRRIAVAVGNVCVEIIDGRRDPDSSDP